MAQVNVAALTADIEKWITTYGRTYAKQAANNGTKLARNAIMTFYFSWTPNVYVRTGNLSNSFKRYYHDNGSIVYGGVRIGSDEGMSEYQYGNWSAATVASMAWKEGSHGGIKNTTPPLSIARIFFNNGKGKWQSIARNTARNQNYQVLNF